MKKISFEQMIVGLDHLFFHGKPLETTTDAIERVDTISAYLEGCGYSWDDILDNMLKEPLPHVQAPKVPTRIGSTSLS